LLWDETFAAVSSLGRRDARRERMSPLDPDSLARVLNRHGPALVLYARQWCANPEDVVQEAFVRLAGQAAPPRDPVGWLYRVVRNGAINESRSAGRRARREAAAVGGEPWFHDAPGDRLDAAAATQALAGLPIHQRETIVARLWGGLAFEEIARLTGSTASTVHRWYHQGLEALRERLGVSCQDLKNP
jgi:RNA polymerase sigma factor (sigma-70 family)